MKSRGRLGVWVIWGTVLLVSAALLEAVWKTQTSQPPQISLEQLIPEAQRDPGSAAVRLEDAELTAFIAREPLRVGSNAPRMKGVDFRDKPFAVPPLGKKPTLFVVACGCLECAQQFFQLQEFHKRMGEGFDSVGFVSTTSEAVWGHHAGTFGMQRGIRLVHDEEGAYLRLMRPPGKSPTRLPIVWACDADGKVRFVSQPEMKSDWTAEVTRALRLRPARSSVP